MICADLGITQAMLELWERTTPTNELRPPSARRLTTTLRSDGASIGPSPERGAGAGGLDQFVVHEVGEIVAGQQRCRRCGMMLPDRVVWVVGARVEQRVSAEGEILHTLQPGAVTRADVCKAGMGQQRYSTRLVTERRRVFVPVPFDPDAAWGHKTEHHVRGTINGLDVRGVLEPLVRGPGLVLGPAWRRDRGLDTGALVDVMLEPEGPQRVDLANDITDAFAATPAAGVFFDSIAQFYRNAYLRYVDATKRRPQERAARIAEVVALLAAGAKERPKQ